MARRRKWIGRTIKITGVVCGCILVIAFIPRRIDKPIDRAPQVTYSVSDPAFRDSIGNLVSAPLLKGNKVETLVNGAQIFPAMLAAITNARQTITLENFIFRSGKLSAQLVPALCDKARA